MTRQEVCTVARNHIWPRRKHIFMSRFNPVTGSFSPMALEGNSVGGCSQFWERVKSSQLHLLWNFSRNSLLAITSARKLHTVGQSDRDRCHRDCEHLLSGRWLCLLRCIHSHSHRAMVLSGRSVYCFFHCVEFGFVHFLWFSALVCFFLNQSVSEQWSPARICYSLRQSCPIFPCILYKLWH